MTCRTRNSRTTRHRPPCARETDVLAVSGELDIVTRLETRGATVTNPVDPHR